MKYKLEFQTADMHKREALGTGIPALDRLLDGGYERGLIHLFYGDSIFRDDFLRAAVWAQVSKENGGLESPVIFIDSSNMIDTVKLNDFASEYNLEIETVMDNIFVSRAFNSSQTYDLIIHQLDKFLERVPARLLIIPGLPDLFNREGYSAEKAQQVTHMAARLMARTLEHNLITLVSTGQYFPNGRNPSIGKALSSNAQIHIFVERTPMRVSYTLRKHPSLPERIESRVKYKPGFGVTLPLQYYFDEKLSTT